jgi:hypothetical protein
MAKIFELEKGHLEFKRGAILKMPPTHVCILNISQDTTRKFDITVVKGRSSCIEINYGLYPSSYTTLSGEPL